MLHTDDATAKKKKKNSHETIEESHDGRAVHHSFLLPRHKNARHLPDILRLQVARNVPDFFRDVNRRQLLRGKHARRRVRVHRHGILAKKQAITSPDRS